MTHFPDFQDFVPTVKNITKKRHPAGLTAPWETKAPPSLRVISALCHGDYAKGKQVKCKDSIWIGASCVSAIRTRSHATCRGFRPPRVLHLGRRTWERVVVFGEGVDGGGGGGGGDAGVAGEGEITLRPFFLWEWDGGWRWRWGRRRTFPVY